MFSVLKSVWNSLVSTVIDTNPVPDIYDTQPVIVNTEPVRRYNESVSYMNKRVSLARRFYDNYLKPFCPKKVDLEYVKVRRLGEYKMPPLLAEALKVELQTTDFVSSNVQEIIQYIRYVLPLPNNDVLHEDCLTEGTYEIVLHLLLYIEEYQQMMEVAAYNNHLKLIPVVPIHNLNPKLDQFKFKIKVDNLSEHRPSIMRGGKITVWRHNDLNGSKYEGIVVDILKDSIIVYFNKSFHMQHDIDFKYYSCLFWIERDSTRKEHRAVQLIESHNVKQFLFPNIHMLKNLPLRPRLNFFNSLIEKIPEQREAVENIVSFSSNPVPFLLFGPPGTGKTSTIVEAVKQIWKTNTNSHILVCVPSNSAANMITERLIDDIKCPSQLIRLMAASQVFQNLPTSIKPFTNYNAEDQKFFYPPKKDLMMYRIVVITLITGARLVSDKYPIGHFTHVFIDECGQATETEALVPIAGLITSPNKIGGQIILSGDPYQLGPIINSPIAKQYGFGRSLLERLMTKVPLYEKNPTTKKYNSRVLMKLVKNFRSHSAILSIPNQKFYDNELIACASERDAELAIGWRYLPNKKFPIIFHASYDDEETESNSPSYFNSSEIKLVMYYLKLIINKQLNPNMYRVTQNDIGIVAPYKKQSEKLQNQCQRYGWNNIVIGSVNQLQGAEKPVIILTTVRSQRNFDARKTKAILGFLTDEKRFNVALTRAKSLLIVIGNPDILRHDKNWYDFIEYCDNYGALINKQQQKTKHSRVR